LRSSARIRLSLALPIIFSTNVKRRHDATNISRAEDPGIITKTKIPDLTHIDNLLNWLPLSLAIPWSRGIFWIQMDMELAHTTRDTSSTDDLDSVSKDGRYQCSVNCAGD
jgi:hypothetical protein